jgi:hypothetical protein
MRRPSRFLGKKLQKGVDPFWNLRRLKDVVVERIHGRIQGDRFIILVGLSEVRMTDHWGIFISID